MPDDSPIFLKSDAELDTTFFVFLTTFFVVVVLGGASYNSIIST
jgi:hypothetical protein